MKIGNLSFAVPIFLAPMAGVTDRAYRILAHELGCSLVFSEMVSASGIGYRNEHTLAMLETDAGEHPIAIQLFGHDPKRAAQAAAFVEELGAADIIDFNMGCPAPKIVGNGDGCALMKTPELAGEIMKALKRAVSLPVTVKMRLGWDDDSVNVLDLAKRAEDAGVDAIAVHGRTRRQFYSGNADWKRIAEVVEAVSIPVIANGDVRTVDDFDRICKVTGAAGVMIGRAAQGDPWVFQRMRAYFERGERLPMPTPAQRRELVLRHLDMLIAYKGEYIGIREMRRHATWYTRGLLGSARLRERFNRAESREDFESILADL
ncbi:tRNA dihydrouridine synthase DusB [Selenomonas sp. TAMA-11512]|uniref:tRNA dihydrouridine synthase DusB n=1 Tax=Selenomonas sp. TAMA-11512 TaxID=3095337 RepID=UPI0030892BB2|nr:tRNA dihydrouridine synthase DusB [Selenomonas sp. TAMA-11512]